MERNKINFQTVSTVIKTFQILRNLSSRHWHVLEGAAKMARLGQIPKLSGTDVQVQALIPKWSSVCLPCSESRDTWGAVASSWGCWGAVVLHILPSGCRSAVSILAFLVWQVLQVSCRVMLCATNLKPVDFLQASRTKLVEKPSSCLDVPLQKHCHPDSSDNSLESFFLHKLCCNL